MTKEIYVYVCDECGVEKTTNNIIGLLEDVHPFKDWLSLGNISPFLDDKIKGETSHEFCGKDCLISFLNKLE